MDAARGNGAVRDAAAGRIVVVIPTLDEEQWQTAAAATPLRRGPKPRVPTLSMPGAATAADDIGNFEAGPHLPIRANHCAIGQGCGGLFRSRSKFHLPSASGRKTPPSGCSAEFL
jgi:hypothetical protein